jgi:hypothetical protein
MTKPVAKSSNDAKRVQDSPASKSPPRTPARTVTAAYDDSPCGTSNVELPRRRRMSPGEAMYSGFGLAVESPTKSQPVMSESSVKSREYNTFGVEQSTVVVVVVSVVVVVVAEVASTSYSSSRHLSLSSSVLETKRTCIPDSQSALATLPSNTKAFVLVMASSELPTSGKLAATVAKLSNETSKTQLSPFASSKSLPR